MQKPKPSTISRDPYAADDPYAFIGGPAKLEVVKPESAKAERPKVPEQLVEPPAKKTVTEKITIPFPADLIERVRTAVYWEPDVTLAGLIVGAVETALYQMEKARGGPYPPRKRRLRSGRPVGSGKDKQDM